MTLYLETNEPDIDDYIRENGEGVSGKKWSYSIRRVMSPLGYSVHNLAWSTYVPFETGWYWAWVEGLEFATITWVGENNLILGFTHWLGPIPIPSDPI